MKYFYFPTYNIEYSKNEPVYKEYWLYNEENEYRKWAHFGNWFANPEMTSEQKHFYQGRGKLDWCKRYPKSYGEPIECSYEDIVLEMI